MIEIGNISSTPIEKVLNINDVNDNVAIKYAIGEKDSLTKMLMQEHNVSISFRYPTFISFKKGYYLTFNGIKYWLMNDYKAVESNGEYRYDLVFHAKEMLFQDVQYWYDKNNIDQSEYGLTGNASYFLQLAVENINKHYGANFVNQGTVEPTDIKYIQFANDTNVFHALSQVCDTFECEWLIVGDTINIIEKANFGDAVDFKVGETVLKIDRREGENTFDANRILALGSTLNLTESYQGGDYMIGSKRLRIPTSKGKYIDLKPNLKPTEVKTATVIFDDIFPKRVGDIDAVREIEYKVDENGNEVITKQYRFKDNGIVFSDDYLLPNEPLMLVFETGKLAGLHFELYFSKDGYSETDNSQYYEILVNNTYGSQLPNETLKPEIDDKYVLYNFNIELVSHIYIPEAENELFEYATRWLKEEWIDKGVYECPIMGRYSRNNDVDLEIGQRVDLYSPTFDSGKRESRVMGYVKPLMSKFDAVYTIGDNKAYSSKSNIQQRITKLEATEYAINGVSGSSGDVYIIKQFDNSLPTDFNVYSAKASDYKYLNKRLGGTVQGDTLFQKNVQVQGNSITDVIQNSTFTAGAFGTGFQIKNDANGYSYGELDYLRVRKEMIVSQLTIDEIKSVGGTILLSLASLTASNVIDNGTSYRVYFDNQDGKLLNKFVVGDQAIRQTFNGTNIVRYWRLVTGVGADYIDLSKTDAEQGSSIPLVGDEIIQLGNRTNAMRQHAILLSAYGSDAPSIKQYSAINSFSLLNKEATVISPSGNKFKGTFEITSNGTTTVVYKDRGLFANGTQYYKNDRVSWLGSLWVCLEDTKVIPSETATFWRKETSGQVDINNSINNIQIGGVNKFRNSNFLTSDGKSLGKPSVRWLNENRGKQVVLSVYISTKDAILIDKRRIGLEMSLEYTDGTREYYVCWKWFDEGVPTTFEGRISSISTLSEKEIANVAYCGAYIQTLSSGSASVGYAQIETGNKATSWSPAPEDVQSGIDNAQNTANSSKNYIDNVLQNELKDIRDQIDGKVNSYFYDYDPTVNNIPASEWTTEEDKESHLNDTFTNTYSGMSWRWLKVNGVYDWVVISDTAATEALAKAAEALQIANNKMQVFVSTPYTPYQVGDLWVQGVSGDILRCNNSRQSGDFDANDWGKASNYTDDTKANEANDKSEYALNEITVVRSEFNSKLSVQNDKINAKVSQVDFDNLDNEVTNTKSEVEQLAGSLTSTIEKVDNIQIGGVNLCSNTDVSKDGITSAWLGWKGTMRYSKGNYIRLVRSQSTDQDFGIQSPLVQGGLKKDKEYTVSFEIGSYYSTSRFNYNFIISSVGNTRIPSSDFSISAATTDLQYKYFTFKADKDYPDARIMIGTGTGNDALGGQGFTIRKFQVEVGNKATPWSPSPQDYLNGIEDAQNTANSKTRTYRQDTTPIVPSGGHTVGDTWYYESLVDFDGNINTDVSKNEYQLVRRWSGSDWVRINWSASRAKVVQTDYQIRQTVEKTGIDQLGQGENLYSVFDQRADSITLEVSRVSNKADAAQNTANNANNAASDAQDKANKAEQDALNAQTKADDASSKALQAQSSATSAQNSANTANSLLTDLSSDGKLTPNEKIDTKRELDIIKAEYPKNIAQADKFGVAKTSYTNAYNALNTYLTPLLSNLTVTSNIVANDFTNKFKDYYVAQTDLLNAVAEISKSLADNAQLDANKAQTDANNAQTSANNAMNKATKAESDAAAAMTNASNAQTSANSANAMLLDIAADNKFTPNEKVNVAREWETIKSEYPKNVIQADNFGVNKVAYTNAYTALNNYITPLLSSMTSTSNINNTTFTNTFKDYYDAQVDLLNNVSTKAKQIADSKTTEAEVKAGIKVTANGVNVYGNEFKVDSTLIANAIETEDLDVGNGNFNVSSDGIINAKGANIQGNVETDGTFGVVRLRNGGFSTYGKVNGVIESQPTLYTGMATIEEQGKPTRVIPAIMMKVPSNGNNLIDSMLYTTVINGHKVLCVK